MSNAEDYNSKIGVIEKILDKDTKSPNIPIDTFTQEAENLYAWSQKDKVDLTGAGLDWEVVKDLPTRAGCLREAESRWYSKRFTKEEAQREWAERAPDAFDLRDQLLHAFTYAYRNTPDVASRVSDLREGSSSDDMIQDLNTIAVIGRENPEPLRMINFEEALLEQAANTADEMGALLGKATADDEDAELVKIRNKAYTHLKEAVDEIRDCGQYVFWRDNERLKGYGSDYFRRQNRARKRDNAVPEETGASN